MIFTCAREGLTIHKISVEADILRGLPYFGIVGLAGTSIKEARERIQSAIIHSQLAFPRTRKIINLSPASIPKHGSHFDLAIAIALLTTARELPQLANTQEIAFIGELGLDGSIRAAGSIFPFLGAAKKHGIRHFVIPKQNQHETLFAEQGTVHPVSTLQELTQYLKKKELPPPHEEPWIMPSPPLQESLWAAIQGQTIAKRTLIIAACGGHSVIFRGPPGVGKTILTQALQEILPPLTVAQKKESLLRRALSGLLSEQEMHNMTPPLERITLTMHTTDIFGGGKEIRLGQYALAHHGILLLDETGLFSRAVLDALRLPLEERRLIITRQENTITIPIECIAVAALNACPCGKNTERCQCSIAAKAAYERKIGVPFFDRFDLFLDVERIPHAEALRVRAHSTENNPEIVKEFVYETYKFTKNRGQKKRTNTLSLAEIEKYIILSAEGRTWLHHAAEKLHLSTRGLHRTMRVSRTIADIERSVTVERHHLAEALQYRYRS